MKRASGSGSSANVKAFPATFLRCWRRSRPRTRDNTGLNLVVAFNYGGPSGDPAGRPGVWPRRSRPAGSILAAIDETRFADALDTAGMPDPDLVIRTSGEQRVSNFLPWQSAYAEYVFLPDLWPDFDEAVLARALAEYARRERRFGGLGHVAEGSATDDGARYR